MGSKPYHVISETQSNFCGSPGWIHGAITLSIDQWLTTVAMYKQHAEINLHHILKKETEGKLLPM